MQLNPSTVEAFEAYIRGAEAEMEQTLQGNGPFLWCEVSSAGTQRVRQGKIVTQRWSGKEPVKVPDGLIHDWIGAAFALGTTVKETLALVQDYNNHKNIYKPEVIDSKLMGNHGKDFQIYFPVSGH